MIDSLRGVLADGGWTLVAIAAASALAWTLVLWEWLRLRDLGEPPATLDRVERSAEDDTPPFGLAAIAAPLGRVGHGKLSRASFEARFTPIVRSEELALARPLDVLRVLTACLPLLGLLGTVLGMMDTFRALVTSRSVGAEALAGGISQALITTQAGLVLAVPLLLAHGALAARVHRRIDGIRVWLERIESKVCDDGPDHPAVTPR